MPLDRHDFCVDNDLPALPVIVLDLLQLIADPEVATSTLAAVLASDPALSARALRLANSSFYGLQRHVSSVPEAASVLGLRTLRAIVLTAAFSDGIAPPRCVGFCFELFWQHATRVAIGARLLAREAGLDEDAAFTAGLLHDIGRLVLASALPDEYAVVLADRNADTTLVAREFRRFGVDHTHVGAQVAARWRFPATVVEAIGGHHDAPQDWDRLDLRSLVRLADRIADMIESDLPIADGATGLDACALACASAVLTSLALQPLMDEIRTQAVAVCAALLDRGAAS